MTATTNITNITPNYPNRPVRMSVVARDENRTPTLYTYCDHKVSNVNGVIYVHEKGGSNYAVDTLEEAFWAVTHAEWFLMNMGGDEVTA